MDRWYARIMDIEKFDTYITALLVCARARRGVHIERDRKNKDKKKTEKKIEKRGKYIYTLYIL